MTTINEQIINEVAHIQKKLKKWKNKLDEVQTICSHPNVIKTHKSNTGNWCPQYDSYWTEFKCPDCGLFWTRVGSV